MRKNQKVISWVQRQKQRSVVYKGGSCLVCGYSECIWALQFHHLDPSTKEFAVSSKPTIAWARIKKELDKCVLLCNRCHTEVHHGTTELATHLWKNPTPEKGEGLLKAVVEAGTLQPHRPKYATPKKHYYCKDCGIEVCGRLSVRCVECNSKFRIGKHTTKIQWPSVAELLERAQTIGYAALGRELGVSDNAIRKRIRTRQRAARESNPELSH